jgi:hypothetical protein
MRKGTQWFQDVLVLAGHLSHGPLDAAICQLVEVRVLQFTGCAFCLGLLSAEGWSRSGEAGHVGGLARGMTF